MAIADGVYRIETAMDVNVMDIDGISQANKANLMICAPNSGNNQKFKLTTNGSYRQLFACHSNKVLEVFGRLTAVSGDNISQYTSNNGVNQKWTLEDSTDSAGAACVIIRSAMNAGFVMDAAYKTNKSGDNVMLGAYNGGDNQKWVFHKDCYYDASLPVPSAIGLAYEVNGKKATGRSIHGTRTLYPAWVGQNGGYQLRYRTKGRKTDTDSWSGWSAWKSPTGATTDSGWGNVWAQTGSVSGSKSVKYGAGIDFTVDQGTYDKLQVQVEIRRFNANGSSTMGATVGGSATGTINIYFAPVVTFGNISFAPDGLRVPYASDYTRNPNKLNLTLKVGGKTLVRNYQVTQKAYDDTVTIPFSKLAFIPDDGASCSIACTFITPDGISFARNATKPIRYSTGHGSSISATWATADGYAETVSLGSHALSAVWLQIDRGGQSEFVECEEISTGKFSVVPPIGVSYKVFCMTQDSSDVWATRLFTRGKLIAPLQYMWNYDGLWTALALDAEMDKTTDRDYENHITSGRRTEVVHFGEGSAVPITVNGSVVPLANVQNANYDDFERLATCDYAVFRTPIGGWYRVAVVSVNESMEWTKYKKVSVKMREVS